MYEKMLVEAVMIDRQLACDARLRHARHMVMPEGPLARVRRRVTSVVARHPTPRPALQLTD